MQESFPFDHVVITFPDTRAAEAARQGPFLHIRRKYPHTRLIATTDPHDARVGSGGGTLAALPVEGSTVLMLHAGGQSSRCPTQMVLGKAWTSLPTREHQLITPIEVWIQQCHDLFQGIPKGALVVVSSDTLLQLPHSIRPQWSSYEGVLGLAVPAPLHTAQNHGVFSLATHDNNHHYYNDDSEPYVASCQAIYQKPSLEVLETIAIRQHAWIDTGVIVFFPSVARSLRRLAQSTLAACTASGLETMWKRESSGESLMHFARRAALPVDLYTHFLQAFRLEEGSSLMSEKKRRYCEKYRADGISLGTLASIFDTLHRHTLRILAFPKGKFLHLGTTRELVEFYAMAHPPTRQKRRKEDRLQLCASFCEHLGLTHRLHALTILPEGSDSDSNTVNPSAIIYHSIIESTCEESCIGANTIIEHCSIETDHALRIGRNCLISGLRYSAKNSTGNGDIPFTVPDGTLIQVLPLRDNKGKTIQFVHMVLGIDDAIEHKRTLYGLAFERFLSWTFLSDEDVWPDEETESKQTLWTAELHPIVESGLSSASVFSWLFAYTQGKKTSELLDWEKISLSRWKSSRRLSLAQIRNMADASKEFSYRQNLIGRDLPNAKRLLISNIFDALMNRELSPLNLQSILNDFAANGKFDDVQRVLLVLIEVISRSLRNEAYDICGQACAVSSSFLSDFNLIASSCVQQLNEMLGQITWEGASFVDIARKVIDECDTIKSSKDSFNVLSLSIMLEQASFAMTRKCICDVASQWQLSTPTESILNQWVLATAPARIDFAGGWSDTAPICYHGSSVVGAAVTIGDNVLPLSCRCRIVSGGRGVYLCTEQRNLVSGALEACASQTLSRFHDLQDFRYPEASCALLKCALYTLGMMLPADHSEDLQFNMNVFQEALNSFCGSRESDVMLEIISTSLLPHGSGMGTSSILGGCVLAAILRCVGKGINDIRNYQHYLIEHVCRLEQHLSTGGGFQDQVNGLIGGVKIVRCEPDTFPLRLNIEQLALPSDFEATINKRLHIAFTGQTRLAKNILQDVLRRWSKRTKEITETVEKLVLGAESVQEAFLDGDIETVADCVNDYWNLKKVMAGPASGVAPPQVENAIDKLMEKGLVAAASLCGAGGGGFLVAISTEENVTKDELDAASISESGCNFVWHECKICSQGLSVQVLESNERGYFDIKWHKIGL
ncbi:fucokinase [Fistulifera solaris]|uniref:Fucokinase n=1 Tax=Fistulifera solaris TaxID=1519565 RepID=A0A1Z5KL61_FISSO|nr:fucokinase [Fistulifera solaris]|eukprot:GAX27054.1 fucokinase [Fistulifera solaris]